MKYFSNQKTSGPSPRVGRPGSTMVHGGPQARVWPVFARRRYAAPKPAADSPKWRGGSCDPHQGLQWPRQRRGRVGGGEEQTAVVKLGARATRLRRSKTGGGIGCGGGSGCSRHLL
jgi:hypothetical protein